MSIKSERVSSEILKELGNIILTESTDKSFKNVGFVRLESKIIKSKINSCVFV